MIGIYNVGHFHGKYIPKIQFFFCVVCITKIGLQKKKKATTKHTQKLNNEAPE